MLGQSLTSQQKLSNFELKARNHQEVIHCTLEYSINNHLTLATNASGKQFANVEKLYLLYQTLP